MDVWHGGSYNYGLAGSGDTVKHHEQGHPEAAPDTEAMIIRHPTLPITTYEIAIPASALQVVTHTNRLTPSLTFGVGIAVNDGDLGVNGEDIGESGQQGWSGWGPYTVVYGKSPTQAGLITLTPNRPAQCATDAMCTGEGIATKPIANERCPATISCDQYDGGSSYTTWVVVVLLIVAGVGVWKYWPLIVAKIPADMAAKLPKGGGGGGGIESGLGGAAPPPASGDSIYG